MLAIALVLEGRTRTEAAETCGMDRQTLRDWVHRYNDEGLTGLLHRSAPGPAARLSAEQEAELARWIEEGPFLLKRKTRRDRLRAKLGEIKEELRWRRHQPIPEQGSWLAQVVRGFFAYHAVPTNYAALCDFRAQVIRLWRRSLRRRSQTDDTLWTG